MIVQQAAAAVLHLFFPRTCSGCGVELPAKSHPLCVSCIRHLPLTNFHRYANNPVEKIFAGRLPVVQAMSYLYFTKHSLLQQLLHQFKYKGGKRIGMYFGQQIADCLKRSERFSTIDAIVPLPLFKSRQKERGYNQAAVLCESMAAEMQLPVLDRMIERIKGTNTQTHMNRMQRNHNMDHRFSLADPGPGRNRHILLVDDVITTGATLEACGRELLKVPGLRLSIATLAFTTA